MLKKDFIELGIDEETAAKCEKASKEELKGFVPKERFNEVNGEKKAAEADLKNANEKIKEFEGLNLDSTNLKEEVEKLKADNLAKDEAHQKEMHQLKVNNTIEKAIASKKGKNATAIKALLENDKFKLDEADFAEDGTVKGLNDRLDELLKAEDSAFLFDTSKDTLSVKGVNPGESGNEELDNSVNFNEMSYEEIAEYLEEHPEI